MRAQVRRGADPASTCQTRDMPTPEIIERVRQLRTQLGETQPADPETSQLVHEIDSVLADPAHAPRYDGLGERLRSASTGVEVRHPQLAASVQAVINALSAAGV